MQPKDAYCKECGQKFTTGKIPLKTVIAEILEDVLSLESRLLRTLGQLFIPGKLTNEYFKGRHVRYTPPFRLFFVTAVVHFAVLTFGISGQLKEELGGFVEKQRTAAYRAYFKEELKKVEAEVVPIMPDTTQAQAVVDSINARIKGSSGHVSYQYYYIPSWRELGKSHFKTIELSWKDLYTLTPDEIIEKKQIKGVGSKMQVKQLIRLNKEPQNFVVYLISNAIWLVLLMMPALALVLKLLYIRRGKYYVEHLIFSFHFHAFAFLLFTLGFLLDPNDGVGLLIAWLAVIVYLYIAMLRVYKQHWFKTLLKYVVINNAYLFIFIFAALITTLVGATIY